MSTSLKSAPKNTKYYINSAIGVAIMVFFGMLPPFSTVTPMGMKILGIYIGLLWLWSTVDMVWPSLLGILLTGFSGYKSVGALLQAGWGDGTVIYIWLICMFAYFINKSGVSNIIVHTIMTAKFSKGKPWVISLLFFTSAYVVGALVSMTPACLLVWALFEKFAEDLGYKKGDRYVPFMIVGIALSGLMGFALFYFRLPGSIFIGYAQEMGVNVNFLGYTIESFLIGFGSVVVYTLFGKFIIRPNVEPIKAGYDFGEGEKITSDQRSMLILTFALVVVFIIQSMWGKSAIGAFLTKLGTSGIVVCFLLLMGFIKRKDGNFFADLIDGTKNGVPWPVFYILIIGMPLAFAMTDETLGINTMLSSVFDGILGGSTNGFIAFVLLVTALCAISTQFLLNQIPGMVIFPIAAVYAQNLGIHLGVLCLMLTICSNASIVLPSANPIAGVMHGKTNWIDAKEIYRDSIPLVLAVWILAVIGWLVFGNVFMNIGG